MSPGIGLVLGSIYTNKLLGLEAVSLVVCLGYCRLSIALADRLSARRTGTVNHPLVSHYLLGLTNSNPNEFTFPYRTPNLVSPIT